MPEGLEWWQIYPVYAILFAMSDQSGFSQFLATPEPPDLGPGPRARVQSESQLNAALDKQFQGSSLPSERRQLIRALILLWHDHLDAAHQIAQSVEGPDGAFVHGIMHRREPDSGNAAYWFRRVGPHAAFEEIAGRVTALPAETLVPGLREKLVRQGKWDAFGFINACQEASGEPRLQRCLREVQRLETEVLLNWLAEKDH
jgi:hypothetical protein